MFDSKFLQLVLWLECNSCCVFCQNRRGILTKKIKENKIENIKKAIDLVKTIKQNQYDFIGIVGGEFFQGQITEDVSPYYKELINEIKTKIDKNQIKQLFVATSLVGPNNYDEFLKYFSDFDKDKILICTSYNTWGQFCCFPENNWQENYKNFIQNGYRLHIEMISSESNLNAIMNGTLDLDPWLKDNIRIDFIRPIDFADEPKYNFPSFFPKRETFINFLMFLDKNYPKMLKDFMSLKQRASFLYNFTFDEKTKRNKEFDEGNDDIMQCGHSSLFKAYIDSDKCMACDIISFNKKINKNQSWGM